MYAKNQSKQKGIALIVAMLFVMVFSALSVAMFSMSSGNSLVASNLHKANQARSSAESGLEIVRYYLNQISIHGLTVEDDRFAELAEDLVTEMNYANYDALSDPNIYIASSNLPVQLSSTEEFFAEIIPDGTKGVNITITGKSGKPNNKISRTIKGYFSYGIRKSTAFDFGVATKGPLALTKIAVEGMTVVDSDVYIESYNGIELDISNSQIAGNVKIVNPDGSVSSTGQFSIGGEAGVASLQNHVEYGVDETEFPVPNTSHFEQFVKGVTIDSNNIDSYTSNATLENVRIAAGTNPTFDGQTTVNGVMYIEQPNVVTFGGQATITGVIVGDGDTTDHSGENQLIFRGGAESSSVESLPQTEQYAGLHDETGTFVMAPGFAVSMAGDFGTVNGCIVANGIDMEGSTKGTIGGSIINYSTELMTLGGSYLLFNRSGNTEVPAGLILEIVMHYSPSDYEEVI